MSTTARFGLAAPDVRLRDVTLRDGLQDEVPIPTAGKLAVLDALLAAGVRDLEVTSFTRPGRVPAMDDADVVAPEGVARAAGATRTGRGATVWGLVLNRRGAERALAAGLRHLQFVVSVSERHNVENTGRTVDRSLAELAEVLSLAGDRASVELTLATAFGCPFEGPVAPGRVLEVAVRAREAGVTRFTLADTIGTAVPTEVAALVADLDAGLVPDELGVHLHDTRGLAIANALAAVVAGARRLDGTVGGLGGCPFAPGASGNLVLEDLVHALEAMGTPTGIDLEALLAASWLACRLVGRVPEGHLTAAGPRFSRPRPAGGAAR